MRPGARALIATLGLSGTYIFTALLTQKVGDGRWKKRAHLLSMQGLLRLVGSQG